MTKEEMSKDEILRKWVGLIPYLYLEKSIGQMHSAMDEYAKQQAIAFGVFRDNYRREESGRVREEEKRLGGMITWIGAPDEEIYNQFIEQQNKGNESNTSR